MEIEPSELDFSSARPLLKHLHIFFFFFFLSLCSLKCRPTLRSDLLSPCQNRRPPLEQLRENHTFNPICFRRLGLVRIGAWVGIIASFFHWSGGEKPRSIQFDPSPEAFAAQVWLESAPGLLGVVSFFFVVHLCVIQRLAISALLNQVHWARFP